MTSSKPTLRTGQLIANPNTLGLIIGLVPTTIIPHSLLLIPRKTSQSFKLYMPFSNPLFPTEKKIIRDDITIEITRDLDLFAYHVKKENTLEVDSFVQQYNWEQIYQRLVKKKKSNLHLTDSITLPNYLTNKVIDQYKENHSQVEMGFIYACSYIKAGVGVEEIRFQMHDYLQAKTQLKSEVTSQVICQKIFRDKGGKGQSILIPPSLIHLEIELRMNGLSSHFFKTMGLVDPLKKKAISPAIKRYRKTLNLFNSIIMEITTAKLPLRIRWKNFPWLIQSKQNKEWQLMTRRVFLEPSFTIVTDRSFMVLNNGEIYSLVLRDLKCGIIMGLTIIVNNNRIEILEKYGWEYLQFPW